MFIGDVKQQSNRQNHIDLYNINQSIDSVQSIYQFICEIRRKTFERMTGQKSEIKRT